jgi:putative addiction module component (TIGR02574 family)
MMMSSQVEEIHERIQSLNPAERADLAHRILLSLEPEDEGAEQAWSAEIKDRLDEMRRGRVQSISESEVFAEIEKEFS